MNRRSCLFAIIHYIRKPCEFISTAKNMKWLHVLIQFLVVLCFLCIPVFLLLIKSQPSQIYERMFSLSFSNSTICDASDQEFTELSTEYKEPTIILFIDHAVYVDKQILLAVPTDFLGNKAEVYTFRELFDVIAVYNGYITEMLLPVMVSVIAVMLILQMLFTIMSASFMRLCKSDFSQFAFVDRMKLAIMGSLAPAMVSSVIGLFLPGVHIILFQLLALAMIFYVQKQLK